MKFTFNYLGSAVSGSDLQRNICYTFGRQILSAVAQLLLVVLIARRLGPVGNGQYAMAILLPNLLVTLLNFGVGPATVYLVSRGVVSARHAVRENSKMAIVTAILGSSLSLPIILFWGGKLFPGVPLFLLLLGLAVFPVSLLLAYLNSILQGLEDFRPYNWTIMLPSYVTLAGVWILLCVFDFEVSAAVVAYAAGQVIGLTAVVIFITHSTSVKLHTTSSDMPLLGFNYKRKVLNYGWKVHISNTLAFMNYRADIFLVNLFLNPAATGFYFIAVQIAERLWMVSQAASTVLLPRLSAMHHDRGARSRLTRKSVLFVSAITLFEALFVAGLLKWLIEPIFGIGYSKALAPFLCLLPGIIAGSGARVQSNCIAAAGYPEWNMYVAMVVLILNIGGNIVLIPIYGITGAAMATSFAYLFNAVVKIYLVDRT